MDSIKLNTRLGNCKLNISAQVQNDKIEKVLVFALKYLIWHVVQGNAFSKDSGFSNKSEYNEKLSEHMIGASKKVLGDYFSDIEIATAGYDKPDPIAKLIKQYMDLGISEVDAKAMAADVQAKIAKSTEKPVETKVEA
jgi:hypothetical protein